MAKYDLSDSDYNLVAEGLRILLDRTQRAQRRASKTLVTKSRPRTKSYKSLERAITTLERKEVRIEALLERMGGTLRRDMAAWS